MKKVLVVLVVLTVALGGLGGLFAAVYDYDTLLVYGKIGVGDILFKVIQTSTAKIDLVTDEDMQPDEDGVEVGYWEFAAASQPAGSEYEIEYLPSKLVSPTTLEEFEFEVVEDVVSGGDYYDERVITFDGSAAVKTTVKVRLLEAIPEDAQPATDFAGTITVNLIVG